MSISIIHSVLLIITIAISFVISSSALNHYLLQIYAVLFIIYFLSRRLLEDSAKELARMIDSIIFTFVISLLVTSSGGLSSHLFFLYYFLIFTLAILLEPIVSLTITIAIIVFYLLEMSTAYTTTDLIPLVSLPFLTPFAIFIGNQMEKNIIQKVKISVLKQKLSQTKEEEFLFLSLIVKAHIKTAETLIDNLTCNRDLVRLKKILKRASILIDKYEDEI